MAYIRHDNELEKTKAWVIVAVARVVDLAKRQMADPGEDVLETIAKDLAGAPFTFPGTAIIRSAVIIIMPDILHPLPPISMHVTQTSSIGLILPIRMCLTTRIATIPRILTKLRFTSRQSNI
jgi:hypothetical protein